jgi:hypothetical protein
MVFQQVSERKADVVTSSGRFDCRCYLDNADYRDAR